MFSKLFKHKLVIGIILVLILTVSYFVYKNFVKKETQTRYILTQVQKGTIVVSVSGSGQISSLDQLDIKPKVSGEVEEIFVDKDELVKAGQLLLKLKTKDYERAVEDAKLALDAAQATLENLKKNKENAERDLEDNFREAFKIISSTFKELPQLIETLEPIFTKSSYGGDQGDVDYYRWVIFSYLNQKQTFSSKEKENAFLNLKDKYQELRNEYIISFKNSPEILEDWLKKTSDLIKEISDLTRSAREIIYFYKETLSKQNLTPPILLSITENQLTILSNFTTSLDSQSVNLFNLSKAIKQLKDKISDLKNQIEIQEKTIEQKKAVLEKAKENYENCFVKSPFEGKVTRVNAKMGDQVSNVTPLLTLISNQKVAEVSLNEVDVAKVKIGQKAILTLDALPDFTLTGRVSEIDPVGTIAQGVVSYGVKISLDSDDERIKPGMSVNAEIIIEVKSDILVLPNNAVKSQGEIHYVELAEIPKEKREEFLKNRFGVILPTPPKRQQIEIGISNDSLTEILSGLKEGDIVVSSKITPTNKILQKNQRFQIPGMGPSQRMR